MPLWTAVRQWMDRHINYPMALAGASVLGITVFAINAAHGVPLALVAAGKQAGYTFFVAGFITRLAERLAQGQTPAWRALPLSVTVPSLLAIGLTYGIHSLKGTAEPWLSTLPTVLLAPPGFALIAWRARQALPSGSE